MEKNNMNISAKEILRNLISYDTYEDKQNEEIINYIQTLLEGKRFKTEYKSKCLVMSNKDDCRIGFIGHTDTVQSSKDWIYNPLELAEIGDKLIGLGTCDMKGGIAAILKAVMDIDWDRLDYGIKLIFTYDEEIGFGGIKEIVDSKIKIPEDVIVGEPTDNEILVGSKGLLEFKIEFKGKAAHSSNPDKGENAIEKCIAFISDLKAFYNKLKNEKNIKYEIPYTTMNVGKIEGGKSINIVPDYCETYIDFRIINDDQRLKIIEEINRLKKIYQFDYIIINEIKPFLTEGDNNKTANFITEASFIESKNRYILGVGPVNPHEANEYITNDSLDKLVEQYKTLIYERTKVNY